MEQRNKTKIKQGASVLARLYSKKKFEENEQKVVDAVLKQARRLWTDTVL